MNREIYYEYHKVLDMNAYQQIMMRCPNRSVYCEARSGRIRKIFFYNLLESQKYFGEDTEQYSIVITENAMEHLVLERKSRRSMLVYRDEVPVTLMQANQILSGEVGWLKNQEQPVLESLYREMVINQLKPGGTAAYVRQRFDFSDSADYAEFCYGIRYVGQYPKDVRRRCDPNPVPEYKNKVWMSYHRCAQTVYSFMSGRTGQRYSAFGH